MVGPQPGATATHTYATTGTYTVTVTATDTAGLTSTAATAGLTVTASVNLVGNPGFETDLTGWNTSGSDVGPTLTRVADAHSGSWAARSANSAGGSATCTLNDSPNWVTKTVAGTYTATMWVKASAGGQTLKLRFREYNEYHPRRDRDDEPRSHHGMAARDAHVRAVGAGNVHARSERIRQQGTVRVQFQRR